MPSGKTLQIWSNSLILIGDDALLDVRCGLLGHLFVNLDHVFIAQLLSETTLHGAVLARAAPDHRMPKLIQKVPMNLHDG